jgi:imidazolonepropionase
MSRQANLILAPIAELHAVRSGPKRGAQTGDTGRIANAGIALMGDEVEVGGADEILRDFSGEIVDCANQIVTPGLVDCHTHLVWAGSRADEFIRRSHGESYQEIAARGGGIANTMRSTQAASVEQLANGIVERADVLLSLGTTSCEIKASYGDSADACKKELDAIQMAAGRMSQNLAVTIMAAHAIPDGRRDTFLQEVLDDTLPMAASHPVKPRFNDVFCDTGAFSVEESRRVLQRGKELGLIPKIHADEFDCLGGVEMACGLGAASCDHLLASGPKQWTALSESETIAVTMPGTAFYLGKPYAGARGMIDAGCTLALGSDWNPGSSMVPSMAFVMGLAVSKMRLSPTEALVAATANAAAALQMELPKNNFCVWPCESLDELVYQFAYIRPNVVVVGGRRLK